MSTADFIGEQFREEYRLILEMYRIFIENFSCETGELELLALLALTKELRTMSIDPHECKSLCWHIRNPEFSLSYLTKNSVFAVFRRLRRLATVERLYTPASLNLFAKFQSV